MKKFEIICKTCGKSDKVEYTEHMGQGMGYLVIECLRCDEEETT